MCDNIKFPQPLQPGDKIAIVSPAGIVKPDFVQASVQVLAAEGWRPYISPHALGTHGSFSGSIDNRFEDIKNAFLDTETRAILCSRGGYGAIHLLEKLSALPLEQDPKWLIGFSDISALHALMISKGVASLHASMAKHLSRNNGADGNSIKLFDILRGKRPQYQFCSHQFNRQGCATGRLMGGNLAVLQALINTPYDIFKENIILFIEDIGEPIYKVQRMLYQFKLSGVLQSLKGLIVGQFTNYQPDANFPDMESMITQLIAPYSYPVAFNIPIGHVDNNTPIIEGAKATLNITGSDVKLSFNDVNNQP